MSDALRGLQGARHAWWGRCRQQMFPPERAQPSNENKMSDGGRGRASLGVKVWKSSQKWSAQRSAVRSIAWLDLFTVATPCCRSPQCTCDPLHALASWLQMAQQETLASERCGRGFPRPIDCSLCREPSG